MILLVNSGVYFCPLFVRADLMRSDPLDTAGCAQAAHSFPSFSSFPRSSHFLSTWPLSVPPALARLVPNNSAMSGPTVRVKQGKGPGRRCKAHMTSPLLAKPADAAARSGEKVGLMCATNKCRVRHSHASFGIVVVETNMYGWLTMRRKPATCSRLAGARAV